MLNKDVFKKGMEDLCIAFPTWKLDISDRNVMSTWYQFFKGWKEQDFKATIDKYIMENEKLPTIAGLIANKKEVTKNINDVINKYC